MEIIDIDIENINLSEVKNLNLCLGFFDGLHIGHIKLIKKAKELGKVGVMTFDVPPNFALGINTVNSCLTSTYDKVNLLKKIGVEYLFVLRMSKKLLNLTKEEFIEKILKKINPINIFVGEDYRFGYKAEGTPELLKKYFPTHVVPLLQIDNQKVSSRNIKEYVANGEMEKVNKLLGRNYSLIGLVVYGKGNGQLIGFPTANLELDFPYVLPKIGVYMGYVNLLNKRYKAIISVSTHPTIEELNKPIIEVHLLYYNGDLYGKEIEVEFVSYMRDIFRFKSTDELKEQLVKDRIRAKNALKGN